MEKQCLPRHLGRKGKRKKPIVKAVLSVACLLMLVALNGSAIGRYQHEFNSEGSFRAKEFYFTSDFLDGSTHILAPGSTEVEFTLGNHSDELRCSEMDIDYVVTIAPDDGSPAVGVTVSNDSGTLAKNVKSDKTVAVSGLQLGNTYVVTAVGTGGYKETLTAKIKVLPVESVVYKYLDTTNSEYVLLTVWAQGYEGNVEITPPAGLIPDNTDPVMKTAQTGAASITDSTSFLNTGSSADGYASHTYRFFGGDVTAEDFTVTYGSETATEKEPR